MERRLPTRETTGLRRVIVAPHQRGMEMGMNIIRRPSLRRSLLLGVTFIAGSCIVARAQSPAPVPPPAPGTVASEARPSPGGASTGRPPRRHDRDDGRPECGGGAGGDRAPGESREPVAGRRAPRRRQGAEREADVRGGRTRDQRIQTIYNVLKGEYAMLVGVRDADPRPVERPAVQRAAELHRSAGGHGDGRWPGAGERPAAAPGVPQPPTPGADFSRPGGGSPTPPTPPPNPAVGQPISQPVPGRPIAQPVPGQPFNPTPGGGLPLVPAGTPGVQPGTPGTGQVIQIVVPSTMTPTTTLISPVRRHAAGPGVGVPGSRF